MLKSKLVHWTNYWYAMRQKFPLFPLRIPHKGKNKGKYISFHYLMGWKACKIRKVQEISPQIPICLLSFYNGRPIVFNSLYMFERNSSIKLFIISGLILGDGVFGFFTVPGGNPFFFSNVPTLQSLLVFLILYLLFPLSLFLTSCSLLSLLLIDNSSIINSIREIHVLHEDLNIDNPHV